MPLQTTPKTEILLEQLLRTFESYKTDNGSKVLSRHKTINALLDLYFEVGKTLNTGSISDLLTKPDMAYMNFKD